LESRPDWDGRIGMVRTISESYVRKLCSFGGQVEDVSPFLFAYGPLRGRRLTAFDLASHPLRTDCSAPTVRTCTSGDGRFTISATSTLSGDRIIAPWRLCRFCSSRKIAPPSPVARATGPLGPPTSVGPHTLLERGLSSASSLAGGHRRPSASSWPVIVFTRARL